MSDKGPNDEVDAESVDGLVIDSDGIHRIQ